MGFGRCWLLVSGLCLFLLAPLIGGCHTTAGLGQDISATGKAVTGGAQSATPGNNQSAKPAGQ